jgi:hypothetical protein
VKQYSTDGTTIDAMNIGKNEMVFLMDMGEEERFRMPIPKSMVICNDLIKMQNDAKQLTKKSKPRITVVIAAMTYKTDYMGHMRQYWLLVYNNSGIPTNRTNKPLVGWIVTKTTRAMKGGSYMALSTYKKDIHMIMIDHATGICARRRIMIMGNRCTRLVSWQLATTLVLLGPESKVKHQAISAQMDKTWRLFTRPLGCMVGPCGQCYLPQYQ